MTDIYIGHGTAVSMSEAEAYDFHRNALLLPHWSAAIWVNIGIMAEYNIIFNLATLQPSLECLRLNPDMAGECGFIALMEGVDN